MSKVRTTCRALLLHLFSPLLPYIVVVVNAVGPIIVEAWIDHPNVTGLGGSLYVASASTGGSFFRSCIGAVIPLAGPPMFQSLGVGWGCSLLALISFFLLPFAWAIVKYSATLRTKYAIKNL